MWSGKDLKRRRELLREWLKPPDADGNDAGLLFGKRLQDIADALSKAFERPISKWSARSFVRELWGQDERRGKLHRGGRPKAERPLVKAPVAAGNTAVEPNETGMLIGALQDVMQLCDISAAKIHHLLKTHPELSLRIGSRSRLYTLLTESGVPSRRAVFPLPHRRNHRALALSIHQLVILGPSCVRVILLASELQTLYLQAQVFEIHLPWNEFHAHLSAFQPTLTRMGAPPRKFGEAWQAMNRPGFRGGSQI